MDTRKWGRGVSAAAWVMAAGLAARAGGLDSGRLTGSVTSHVVSRGETVTSIGARFGIDVRVIVADNQLPPKGALLEGQTLQIDNRHLVPAGVEPGTVVVNVPQRMLFHDDGQDMAAFPAAVGRSDWRTPVGASTVMTKERNPTWDVPPSILEEARRAGRTLPPSIPPGPNNPLGRFWLGLSGGGIGIHGTNAPSSIYRVTTHGCIRLHPDDIASLFSRVSIGTPVRITYEPVLLALIDDEVFLEAHPDAYRRAPDPAQTARALAQARGLFDRIDWTVADIVVAAHDGMARVVTRTR